MKISASCPSLLICTFQNWHTDPWPITSHSSPYILQCTAAHGIWATVIMAMWVVAVGMELRISGWRERKLAQANEKEQYEEAKARVLCNARLMLLGSAALTWLVFALSAQSIANPWVNNRYLIGLAVATPALLWPLWKCMKAIAGKPLHPSPVLVKMLLSTVIILCCAGTLVIGTIDTFNAIPPTEIATQNENALAAMLVKMHLKHIYTDYWTCDLIAFLTKEQVICSVLDEQLGHGVNRYAPYTGIVASDPEASYVFLTGSAQTQLFAKRIKQMGEHYRITLFDRYIIFQPESLPD